MPKHKDADRLHSKSTDQCTGVWFVAEVYSPCFVYLIHEEKYKCQYLICRDNFNSFYVILSSMENMSLLNLEHIIANQPKAGKFI